MATLARLPVFVLVMAVSGLLMWVPAFLALGARDFAIARAFFYSGCLTLILSGMVGLAVANRRPARPLRGHLLALVATYSALPALLSVPYEASLPGFTPVRAYFDMVGSITTTGASAFDHAAIPVSLLFWRGLVAWFGGLVIWTAGVSILAPLNLGGEELITRGGVSVRRTPMAEGISSAEPNALIFRHFRVLAPIYGALTVLCWSVLVLTGDDAMDAALVAMATLSTSGVIAGPATASPTTGIAGEIVIFAFLIFAVTQKAFRPAYHRDRLATLARDRELRLGAVIILSMVALFLWAAIAHGPRGETGWTVLRATWATAFTALSFLTTAGFTSAGWPDAVALTTGEGMAAMALAVALAGGGIATTAGGIKLLRVYALYKHGEREFGRLIYPRSVAAAGAEGRKLRREGAQVAWVFFMLFTLSLAGVAALLSLTGIAFEPSIGLAAAALSTTGPLAPVMMNDPLVWTTLQTDDYLVLSFAMILGRMEALALIGLLNRDFWQ